MNTISFRTTAFRNALIITALAWGLGITAAEGASPDPSAPKAQSDGMGAAISDTAITAEVKAKLMGEDKLKKSDINVTTTNGVVTLEGSASSASAKAMAERKSLSIHGVRSVYNDLKLPATGASATTRDAVATTERAASDSWITTKVKSEILADSLTKGFEVQVETIHGVVVLGGTLANRDAFDHVKDIAAKVEGVKSVNTSALRIAAK